MINGEFKLIDSIRERVESAQKASDDITGIGDDCAVYRISEGRYGLFSTDISIDKVHFDLSYTSMFDIGYRSMTANISDIVSTGGRPVLALVSLAIPAHITKAMINELYDGILACSVKYGTFIAGGDTSSSNELAVNISIYGETSSPVLRSGAKPGDRIYLTGNTGLSKLGLEVLGSGSGCDRFPAAVIKHLRPEPRTDLLDEIMKISPTSMIDVSDGLLIDLSHICEMSGCGFELIAESIPVHEEIKRRCSQSGTDITEYTLYSGEEYELVFTTEKIIEDSDKFINIGSITPSGYFISESGIKREVSIKGYDHFKHKGEI